MSGSNRTVAQAMVVTQDEPTENQSLELLALFDESGAPLDLSGSGGGGIDASELRNIDCVIRYSDVQPERADYTTDLLRRVRWVSAVEPAIGYPYAVDGLDVWENVDVEAPPDTADILRSTPVAPIHNYWSATPIELDDITVPDGAMILVASADASDGTGTSATSTPQLTNSGTARGWFDLAEGSTGASRLWVHYWYNDTGADVTFDLTVTWGPDDAASNFACGVSVQILENAENPETTAPTFEVVDTGGISGTIAANAGDQVMLAFTMVAADAVALGTDYLSGTSSDTSPASADLFTGEMTYGWVFRTTPEASPGSPTVGMNTPDPVVPLNIVVAVPAKAA